MKANGHWVHNDRTEFHIRSKLKFRNSQIKDKLPCHLLKCSDKNHKSAVKTIIIFTTGSQENLLFNKKGGKIINGSVVVPRKMSFLFLFLCLMLGSVSTVTLNTTPLISLQPPKLLRSRF